MRPLLWIPVITIALAVPAVVLASGGSGFNGVVSSIEGRYHVHATRIPLMMLASLVARSATHGGVSSVDIADFEDFSEAVDGDELNTLIEQKLGSGWSRMIRETSKQGKEQTLIFAHPEQNRMGLFVVDLDGHELDVVEVSVDPDHLSDTIRKYDHDAADDHGQANDEN